MSVRRRSGQVLRLFFPLPHSSFLRPGLGGPGRPRGRPSKAPPLPGTLARGQLCLETRREAARRLSWGSVGGFAKRSARPVVGRARPRLADRTLERARARVVGCCLAHACVTQDEDEFSVSGDEDHDVVDEDELSSETRRLRAQYGDPRRRGPSTRATKGRSAVAGLADGDDGEDDDDDDESVPKSKCAAVVCALCGISPHAPSRGGRRGGARPSRQRKRVVRGEAAEQDELDELLGNEEEVDEEGDKRRSRARKTGGNDSDEVSSEGSPVGCGCDSQVHSRGWLSDLDTLPTTKTGALGPDRRVDIILDRRANGTAFEYFVKWQGASYLHCSWVTGACGVGCVLCGGKLTGEGGLLFTLFRGRACGEERRQEPRAQVQHALREVWSP